MGARETAGSRLSTLTLAACVEGLADGAFSSREVVSAVLDAVRVVDRGNLNERASDIGGMSIYASSVVLTDPYELVAKLAEGLSQKA